MRICVAVLVVTLFGSYSLADRLESLGIARWESTIPRRFRRSLTEGFEPCCRSSDLVLDVVRSNGVEGGEGIDSRYR